MLQLTYISTKTPGLPDAACDSILPTARRRNLADGVSGLLVFDGRRFLQALEGEADVVERTFRRISADPRHRAIVLLSSREIATRDFGAWAMAAQVAAARSDAATPIAATPIATAVDALTESVADANARALFRSFARLQRAA